MKKILILILTIFISISLIGCDKSQKERLEGEPLNLEYTDMDTFIGEWKQAQKEPSDSPLYWADGVSAPKMLVPTLLSENYSLKGIEVFDLEVSDVVEYCYLSNGDYTVRFTFSNHCVMISQRWRFLLHLTMRKDKIILW